MLIERNIDNFLQIRQLDRYMVGHKGFIAGGCFKNIFCGEPVKDIDVFFRTQYDFEQAVSYFDCMAERLKYVWYYTNDNVVAYKCIDTGVVIELIRKLFGTPDEIVNNFDFTITKCVYYKELDEKDALVNKLKIHEDFFEHLFMKRLVVDNLLRFPASTFDRMIRYISYGYVPCRETKLKIMQAINSLKPEQISVSNSMYDGMD